MKLSDDEIRALREIIASKTRIFADGSKVIIRTPGKADAVFAWDGKCWAALPTDEHEVKLPAYREDFVQKSNRLLEALEGALAEIEWQVDEHGCCAGHACEAMEEARAAISAYRRGSVWSAAT